MGVQIGQDAPDFTAKAVAGSGDFVDVTLSDYAKDGKWVVLYFYPLDFTFVCPTEIRAYDNLAGKFSELGAQVIGCSIDSHFSHLGWLESGGMTESKSLNHPIVGDVTKNIGRDYGVLNEDLGFSLRGTFIIDPKGKIRSITICDAPVGRNVDESIRTLQALQHVDSAGGKEVCPVNWNPGGDTIKLG